MHGNQSGINQSFDMSSNQSSQAPEEKSRLSLEIIISIIATLVTSIAIIIDISNLIVVEKSISQIVLILFFICLTTLLCMIYKSYNCNSNSYSMQKTVNNFNNNIYYN